MVSKYVTFLSTRSFLTDCDDQFVPQARRCRAEFRSCTYIRLSYLSCLISNSNLLVKLKQEWTPLAHCSRESGERTNPPHLPKHPNGKKEGNNFILLTASEIRQRSESRSRCIILTYRAESTWFNFQPRANAGGLAECP